MCFKNILVVYFHNYIAVRENVVFEDTTTPSVSARVGVRCIGVQPN